MYVTSSPATSRAPGATAARPPLPGLLAAFQHVAGPGGPFLPHDRDYLADMLAVHGRSLDEARFAAGRTTFTELVATLVPGLRACADRFDAAVMASAVSDAEPGWPMCYLMQELPGTRLSFGVADQGLLGAFTALRLALDRARAAPSGRTVMVALDQRSVLHDGPVPPYLGATVDAGVALVFESGTGAAAGGHAVTFGSPLVRRLAPPDLAAGWADMVARAAADAPGPLTAIVGGGLLPALPDRPPAGQEVTVRPAAPGRPCTGIWAELVDGLDTWRAEEQRLVLADYDPDLGRLAGCVVIVGPASEDDPQRPAAARGAAR